MTTVFSEAIHAAEAIVSEANGNRSREKATIASGADLSACTVLGRILTAAATAVAAGGNTGNGAMGAITVGADAKVGDYTLQVTEAAANAGNFELIDPDGALVGVGSVGVAFDGGGLSFTLADGATDFAVGDKFTITVAAGSGKYVQLDTSATNGSQVAAAMLIRPAYAASADVDGSIIAREAELNAHLLVWPTGITDPQKVKAIADLSDASIIVRS